MSPAVFHDQGQRVCCGSPEGAQDGCCRAGQTGHALARQGSPCQHSRVQVRRQLNQTVCSSTKRGGRKHGTTYSYVGLYVLVCGRLLLLEKSSEPGEGDSVLLQLLLYLSFAVVRFAALHSCISDKSLYKVCSLLSLT